MIPALIPANEPERVAALLRYDILESEPEAEFDEITTLASFICGTPISVMTLVDSERLWIKSGVGIAAGDQTPRDEAFCAHTILEQNGMIISDMHDDPRFFDNPLVRHSPNIRFYVGMPLITSDGFALGSLCAMDKVPRQLSASQLVALGTLAKQVVRNMELRRSYAGMLALTDRLKRMNAGKDRMFSLVAHDLKSPFSGVLGMLEMMAERIDDMSKGDIQRHLQMLAGSTAETFSLLERLLQWSTFESGEILFRPENQQVDQLLEGVVGLLSGIADRKSITLMAIPNPGATVSADHAMIHSVVQNLVGNALKFTGKNGTITLSSRSLGEQIEISVADTGVGMSPQTLGRILNRSAGNTTCGTDGETGTGLGLNLSQGFIDKHGGKLQGESEVGKGTTFSFTLPRAQPIAPNQDA